MTKRVLDFERVANQMQIPAGLQGLEAQEIKDWAWGNILCRLTAFVLTEKLADETHIVEFLTPRTWFQHLKRDHAPGWVLRRWPVKLTKHYAGVNFQAKGVYPDAPIALPPEKFGQRVIFEEITQGPWKETS